MADMFAVVFWSVEAVDGTRFLNESYTTIPFEVIALFNDEDEARAHIEEIAVDRGRAGTLLFRNGSGHGTLRRH